MTGFVYAIGDETGRVKIGWSRNPTRRLTKINSDCSSAVSLLGVVPALRSQEAEIHALLAPWRVNGEWYRHEGAVAAFVSMLTMPKPKPRLLGTTQAEFARKVQCSDSHLSLILNGERGMSLALAKRISAASGIAIENLPQVALRAPTRAPDRAAARKR